MGLAVLIVEHKDPSIAVAGIVVIRGSPLPEREMRFAPDTLHTYIVGRARKFVSSIHEITVRGHDERRNLLDMASAATILGNEKDEAIRQLPAITLDGDIRRPQRRRLVSPVGPGDLVRRLDDVEVFPAGQQILELLLMTQQARGADVLELDPSPLAGVENEEGGAEQGGHQQAYEQRGP